jgi:uncharacterized RDD family membrane protein YckC
MLSSFFRNSLSRVILPSIAGVALHQCVRPSSRAVCDNTVQVAVAAPLKPTLIAPKVYRVPSLKHRFFAAVIDSGICTMPIAVSFAAFAYFTPVSSPVWPFVIGLMAAPLLYDFFFVDRHSGTSPGKRWMGLRVVSTITNDSAPISWGRLFIRRFFTSYMSNVNMWFILLHPQHRSLADFLAETRVVFANDV